MKKAVFTAGVMGAAMLLAGCRSTQVAEVKRSQEENAWEQVIRENYPNYRPPRSAAPAAFDNTEERVSAVKHTKAETAPAAEKAPELEPVETVSAETAPAAPAVAPAEPVAETPVAEKVPEEKAGADKVASSEAAPAVADTVYVVQSGDTLGKIAQKHYGSAKHSNVIFKANGNILKDPNKLRPGMKLVVPKL